MLNDRRDGSITDLLPLLSAVRCFRGAPMFIEKRRQHLGGSGCDGDLHACGGTTGSVLREAPRSQEESFRKGKSLFMPSDNFSSHYCTWYVVFLIFVFFLLSFPLLIFCSILPPEDDFFLFSSHLFYGGT